MFKILTELAGNIRHYMLFGVLAGLLLGTYDLYALTDPTRPLEYKEKTVVKSYQLESIIFSEQRRVAVINGQILSEGESIGTAKLIRIGRDDVQLQRSGRLIRLKLQRPTIRQVK